MVSKEEALELFKYNAFKAAIITSKIPDGGFTTVYRNGDLIDLCRCVCAFIFYIYTYTARSSRASVHPSVIPTSSNIRHHRHHRFNLKN